MLDPTLIFLLKAAGTSLSGVMAPGPVTAATLEAGARRKHAGAWVAIGHGVIEFPLMLLVMLGLMFPKLFGVTDVLQQPAFRVGVGLAGGIALLALAGLTLWGLRRKPSAGVSADRAADGASPPAPVAPRRANKPLWTGIVLTAGNPYFLLWWATVGLALTAQAVQIGIYAFVFFTVIHWLCDLLWLEALSVASFYGTVLLGPRTQPILSAVCGVAMAGFGAMFVIDALKVL